MDRMIENNQRFRNNNVRGKKKKKKYNRKLDIIAASLLSLAIYAGATNLLDIKAANDYVNNKFGPANMPYPYITSTNGDYFYDNGNYVELSDGLRIIIDDLANRGATLEEIYIYISNNYSSSMLNVYKDYLKENNEELHLGEFRAKVRADQKYDEVMDKGRSK